MTAGATTEFVSVSDCNYQFLLLLLLPHGATQRNLLFAVNKHLVTL